MKALGHQGFGFFMLFPFLLGKTVNYIDSTDKYINNINDIIYKLNNSLIDIEYYLLYNNKFTLEIFINLLILLLLFSLGIRLPDLDLLIKNILPNKIKKLRYLYHRQLTHSLFLCLFFISYFADNKFILIFFYGMFTHLLADMFTGSVPLFLTGVYYKTFNIFKLRIGIDLIYILTKKSYSKNKTQIQIIINKIKEMIVDFFQKISPYILFIFFSILIINKFFNFLN